MSVVLENMDWATPNWTAKFGQKLKD